MKNETKQLDFTLVPKDTTLWWYVLPLPILFLLSIWVIRWNNIAVPSRLDLVAKLKDLQVRLTGTPWEKEFLPILKALESGNLLDWLFWSRGQEMAGWKLAHQAEIAMLHSASPDKVNARLVTVEQRLLESDKGTAKALAATIRADAECSNPSSDDARRQLLSEALSNLYDASDNEFAALTSWQNKAFWLTLVGVILVTTVAAIEKHYSLFVAGAVGGFLSRLTRQLKRADVPTDYGASWSTLFLSPVAGAISGWFGVTLIMLLADPKVGILSGPLKAIDWDLTRTAPVIAAAFVLGFSERLFDKIVAQLEESIEKKQEASQKATPTQTKSPPIGGAGKRGIKTLDPNPAKPGDIVTAQLENIDPAIVKKVILISSSASESAYDAVAGEAGKLTFALPRDVQPGTYRVSFMADTRTDTGKELTIQA